MARAQHHPAATRPIRSRHGSRRLDPERRAAGSGKQRSRVMIFGMGFGGVLLIVLLLIIASFRVLREYQRAVVFMLGRFWKVKGPGLILIIPGVQPMVRVDLPMIVMDVPPQDVITRDNVTVKVDAVIYFRVVDPEKSVIQVAKFLEATSQLAQTTLRAVLGKHELDELVAERAKLSL